MKRRTNMDVRNTTPIDGVASPQSNYEKFKDMFTDKHDLITMDNFYSLLVAEMQNQDPLEPTSNTEFISQMASFTALSAQQDAFNVQQQSYANSLIGKTLTVSTGDGKTKTGVVTSVKSGDNPQVYIDGQAYNLSAISSINDDGTKSGATISDYGAFAAGILGKTAVVQSVDATGATYMDEGTVDSIEIEKGNVRVIVNGYAYNATDVLRVTETKDQAVNTVSDNVAASVQPTQTAQAAQTTQTTETAQTASTAQTQQATQTTAQTDEDDIADVADDGNDDSQIYELFE